MFQASNGIKIERVRKILYFVPAGAPDAYRSKVSTWAEQSPMWYAMQEFEKWEKENEH